MRHCLRLIGLGFAAGIWLQLRLPVDFLFALPPERNQQEHLLSNLKNRSVPWQKRIEAFDQMMQMPTEESRKAVIETLENRRESAAFVGRFSEAIAKTKDRDLLRMLESRFTDRSTPIHARQIAASILWKADPESVMDRIRTIAADPFDNEAFRVYVMGYLAQRAQDGENQKLVRSIFEDKDDSSKVREMAAAILEAVQDGAENRAMYQTILRDSMFPVPARKRALEKCVLLNATSWPETSLPILEDPNEDFILKKAVLKNLLRQETASQPWVTRLRKAAAALRSGLVDAELESLLRQIENENPANRKSAHANQT